MTRAEYYQKKIDDCIQIATVCKKENDIDKSRFFLNSAKGFKQKLEKLTIEQCDEVING